MSERDYQESNLLAIQLYTLIFSLVSVLISMVVTYNQKLSVEKKEVLFESKRARNISLFNRILITGIALVFLYVNFKQYILDKETNNNSEIKNDKLQIAASLLTIVAALITVYVVYTSSTKTITDIENPLT